MLSWCAPYSGGVKLLSEVLPSEADRTFEFAGIVEDSNQIDTQTQSDESPAKCSSEEAALKVSYFEVGPH